MTSCYYRPLSFIHLLISLLEEKVFHRTCCCLLYLHPRKEGCFTKAIQLKMFHASLSASLFAQDRFYCSDYPAPGQAAPEGLFPTPYFLSQARALVLPSASSPVSRHGAPEQSAAASQGCVLPRGCSIASLPRLSGRPDVSCSSHHPPPSRACTGSLTLHKPHSLCRLSPATRQETRDRLTAALAHEGK